MTRYSAEVGVVYRAGEKPGMFEMWNIHLGFESGALKQALTDAIAITRETMDSYANVRRLGYSEKPVLYAVLSLNDRRDLPERPRLYSPDFFSIVRMRRLNESELERLKSYEDVSIPLKAIWLEE